MGTSPVTVWYKNAGFKYESLKLKLIRPLPSLIQFFMAFTRTKNKHLIFVTATQLTQLKYFEVPKKQKLVNTKALLFY